MAAAIRRETVFSSAGRCATREQPIPNEAGRRNRVRQRNGGDEREWPVRPDPALPRNHEDMLICGLETGSPGFWRPRSRPGTAAFVGVCHPSPGMRATRFPRSPPSGQGTNAGSKLARRVCAAGADEPHLRGLAFPIPSCRSLPTSPAPTRATPMVSSTMSAGHSGSGPPPRTKRLKPLRSGRPA